MSNPTATPSNEFEAERQKFEEESQEIIDRYEKQLKIVEECEVDERYAEGRIELFESMHNPWECREASLAAHAKRDGEYYGLSLAQVRHKNATEELEDVRSELTEFVERIDAECLVASSRKEKSVEHERAWLAIGKLGKELKELYLNPEDLETAEERLHFGYDYAGGSHIEVDVIIGRTSRIEVVVSQQQ
jgi:hypothetical protein